MTFLPRPTRATQAAGPSPDDFVTGSGTVTVHPVYHASVVLQTPAGAIYADPVGAPESYAGLPPADQILVTHEHRDHFNVDTLRALIGEKTDLLTNPAVLGLLPADLADRARAIGNGDSTQALGLRLDAVPAYNLTEGRTKYHPRGRDNGYVLTIGDFRVYLSGDTEDTPEMRALKDIDLAFICMVLPYTMDAEHAADAVRAFRPRYVYPYHYGAGGKGEDPAKFADLVGKAAEVRLHDWYGGSA